MTERRGKNLTPSRSGANPYPNARLSQNSRPQPYNAPARLDIPQQARNENNQGAGRGQQPTSAKVTSTTAQRTYPAGQEVYGGGSGRIYTAGQEIEGGGSGGYASGPVTYNATQGNYLTRSEIHGPGQGETRDAYGIGSQFEQRDSSTLIDRDIVVATGATTSSYPTGPYDFGIGQGVETNLYSQPRRSSHHPQNISTPDPWVPPQQGPFVGPSLPATTNARPSFIPQQSPYNKGIGRGSNNQEPRNPVFQDPSPINWDPHRGFNRNVDSVPRQPRRHLSNEAPPSTDYDPSRSSTFDLDPPTQIQHQLSPYPPPPSHDPNQYGRPSRLLERKSSTTTSRTHTTTTSFDSRESAPRYQNIPNPLHCEYCPAVTTGLDRITNMRRHEKEKHGDSKVRCPSCGKDFSRQANLERHQQARKGKGREDQK